MSMPIDFHLFESDFVHAGIVQDAEQLGLFHQFAAHEEVARHRHQRRERQILIDRADAHIRRITRRAERDQSAVNPNLARCRRVDAGENLDQCRLAGPVVAEERMDFAGINLEVDTVQGAQFAKPLHDVLHFDDQVQSQSSARFDV